jgi:hypothetical protein
MVMNPTTLRRVYDNEFRVPSDQDAFTLAELMADVADEVWSELDAGFNGTYTARQPMVSSLRRNLQAVHLQRLIDLSVTNPRFGGAAKPIRNLARYQLRDLNEGIDRVLAQEHRVDPYTIAHLSETKVRIEKALDGQYIYNLDDINVRLNVPSFMFGEDEDN